jgi:hypothetical protein
MTIPAAPAVPLAHAAEMRELDAVVSAMLASGFVVIQRPVVDLRAAYDRAVATADERDVSQKACTRVHDFVNRGAELDLWRDPLLLAICERSFTRPYKLSSYHARAVNPGCGPQELHVDCERENGELALLGFVWMIDAFHEDNGATRFVPRGRSEPVVATGAMGSLVAYDGSILHGYGVNRTREPRRSLQGAFVLRTLPQGLDQRARLRPDTAARLDARARYLLDVE